VTASALTPAQQQALTIKREAYIAGYAHHETLQDHTFGTAHADELTFDEFKDFNEAVWLAEGRQETLMVSKVDGMRPVIQAEHFDGAAAAARWFTVPNWHDGVRFTGQRRLVAYVDAWDKGLSRLLALHELAHLFCDSEFQRAGHVEEWSETFGRLIRDHVSPHISILWFVQFRWWTEKAAEEIGENPLWLADGIDR
jgi:hypothetical protein